MVLERFEYHIEVHPFIWLFARWVRYMVYMICLQLLTDKITKVEYFVISTKMDDNLNDAERNFLKIVGEFGVLPRDLIYWWVLFPKYISIK